MENTAQSIANLFNDARALEKVLKLLQAVCQIVHGVYRFGDEAEAVRWNTARSQIALSRRFFRLFKWVDCWNRARREYEAGPLYPHLLPSSASTISAKSRSSANDYTAASGGLEREAWPSGNEIHARIRGDDGRRGGDAGEMSVEQPKARRTGGDDGAAIQGSGESGRVSDGDEVYTMLAVLKWSLLGMYFLMEMWTITDAMALTSIWHRFGIDMQEEALKMWVYGIASSVVLGVYELFTLYHPVEGTMKGGSIGEVADEKLLYDEAGVTGVSSSGSRSVSSRSRDENGRHEDSSRPGKAAEFRKKRRRVVKQLVVDCCDVLIPASAVGWIPLNGMHVGVAGALSASVSLSGMWMKAAGIESAGRERARGSGAKQRVQ